MTNNIPSNPFERPKPVQDPRDSRLFASQDNNRSNPFEDDRFGLAGKIQSSMPMMSARRALRLKRSQLRRNILVGISIAIGLLLALIATDTIKLGTGPRPTLSKNSESISFLSKRPAIVAGKQLESIRTPTGSDPLRVYIAGDSLVGSYGDVLATSLGESGVIKATYDSRPSSGLVNTDFFDWNSHAKKAITRYDPEVIVFMVGTNDASIVSSNPQGYEVSYKKRLDRFVDIMSGNDRKVIFVLAPAMRDNTLNKNVDKLNDVIYSVARQRKSLVVESGTTLSPEGIFVKTIKRKGKYVTIRSDDGIHITDSGGKLLASSIKKFLYDTFGLDRFFDTPAIKPTKVPGCCTSPTSIPSGTYKSSASTSSSTTTTSASTTTSSTTPEQDSSTEVEKPPVSDGE